VQLGEFRKVLQGLLLSSPNNPEIDITVSFSGLFVGIKVKRS
jgi:hypothetical protein